MQRIDLGGGTRSHGAREFDLSPHAYAWRYQQAAVRLQIARLRRSGNMTEQSRRLAGALLLTYPAVVLGGVSLLSLILGDPSYQANPVRQDLWRAGHAHAGIFLLLSLVILRYVDAANLSNGWKSFIRLSVPSAAILLPVAFFLSVLLPSDTKPNGLIYLAYVGAPLVATALVALGVGLVRKPASAA